MDDLLSAIRKLQDLYDDPDIVTTADQIKIPEPKEAVRDIELVNDFMKRNPRADGGRINFDSGGSPLQRLRQSLVDDLMYKFPSMKEEDMQMIVKDINLGMSTEEAQASMSSNFTKIFGGSDMFADGGRIGFKKGLSKNVIELQKEGGTLLEQPKYKNALTKALDEVSNLEKKGYGNIDGIVKKYQKLFTEKVGSKTRTGKTIKSGVGNRPYKAITFAIREHAKRLNIQSINNLNVVKALDAYTKIDNPNRGDLIKIAKKYKAPPGSFEKYLTNLNLRKKIPLKFDNEAKYKSYLAKIRNNAIGEFSSKKFERFLSGISSVQKSHMGDLYNQFVTTDNIAFAPQKINAEALKTIDANLKSINEEVKLLFKNKPKGYVKKIDALNKTGDDLAAASQGYKKYQGTDPVTGRNLKVVSFSSPGQELDPTSLFGNKKLSELKNQDKALLKVLKKESMKSAKLPKSQIVPMKEKIMSATSKVLKGAGKVLKPLGYAIGTNAVIQAKSMANEMGINLKPQDLFMALDSGDANVAIDNYNRRNIPGYSEKQNAITLSKFQDDFSEVGKEPMNIDLTMPRGFNSLSSGGVASGPPPESGPNPQGLLSLMKRAKNY